MGARAESSLAAMHSSTPVKKILSGALLLIAVACVECGNGSSAQLPPVKDQAVSLDAAGELDPIADARAVRGGSFTVWGSDFPKSLNMWLDFNSLSAEINSLMFESLVSLHSVRNEPVAELASSWKVSPDGRTFTFQINPAARWSDGKPVTAEDVQFYYDVIMNKKHLTPIFRVDLSRFDRPEVLDRLTVRVRAKENHWKNFWSAADMKAFPKHIWKDKDFNKINFEFPVVSGPYELSEVKKNRYTLLRRRGDWWGRTQKYNQHKFNFDYIRHRFIGDRHKTLEALKKGSFDSYPIYTALIWAQQTNFKEVKNNWIVRQAIYNKEPRGFQGFAINLRREKFQDPKVREALCLLLNRKQMNDKFMFNAYFLLNSYYPDLHPNNQNPAVPLCPYNPERARELLKQAGYTVGPKGMLTKNGSALQIVFLTYMTDRRHLELYLGDLKAVGIDAKIDGTSLATVQRRLDQHDFDMFWSAWGASRLRDPESMWHSKTANEKGSQNYPGLQDKQIDGWIEQQRTLFDINSRNAILKKIDGRLNQIRPYVLLWQSDHTRLLYWNRFGTPKSVLGKYNRENAALVYWWLDPKKAAALDEARKKNQALPAEPGTIRWTGP